MTARKQHSLTSAKAWSRYMPGGAHKRPFTESKVKRIPRGSPGGGRFMGTLNGGPARSPFTSPGGWRVNEPLLPASRVLRSGFHIDQQYSYARGA